MNMATIYQDQRARHSVVQPGQIVKELPAQHYSVIQGAHDQVAHDRGVQSTVTTYTVHVITYTDTEMQIL